MGKQQNHKILSKKKTGPKIIQNLHNAGPQLVIRNTIRAAQKWHW